jgi:hypothetical protein
MQCDEVVMLQTPTMSEDEKWTTFGNVDAQCWTQLGAPAPGFTTWQLRDDWRDALFGGAFKRAIVNADQNLTSFRAVVFVTQEDVYEVRVFSRQSAGAFYDFKWRFAGTAESAPSEAGSLERRAVSVALNGGNVTATANVVWLIHPSQIATTIAPSAKNIRVYCAAIDETIDLNLDSLDIRYQESVQEQQMRFVPWQRLLMWMVRLQGIDPPTFGRIPRPLQAWLQSRNVEAQIGSITERDISAWQQQGILPPQLSMMKHEDVTPLRDSIRLQQGLARQPDVMMLFPQGCPIPRLLLGGDPSTLDPLDLQVFMTIGALREMHGFLETEMQRLMERRPDLQVIMQSPQGARQLENDSEIAALKAHPQAVKDTQDMQDVMLRRAGSYGPTMREVTRVEMNRLEMMQAQTMGMMMSPLMGMAAAMQVGQSQAAANVGPPWKLYTPYLI